MIVLKAPPAPVLQALRAVSGILDRRHTLPILANVLIRGRANNNLYDDDFAMRGTRMTSAQSPLAFAPRLTESAGPSIKLAFIGSLEWVRRCVRQLSGFFCASKVNARNAP